QRLYELFVEAVARVLDYVRAHWFILAAAAAGLIAWAVAQRLDYTLWQDHLAKFAPLIAGVPAFKEFKTALSDSDPVLKAAEEALRHKSEDAVKRLFEEAKRAVGQSSKPWSDLRKVARDVEMFGRRVVKPEHAAVAWALLEAGLRELGDVRDKALSALKEAEEKLSRGEEAEIPAKELSEFVRRARDVAHRLELLFEQIAENAEKRGDEEMRRAFAVTELAGELAGATTKELRGLGGATLADKVVAFFESLLEGTAWSRVVINALERGEAYGAFIRTPKTASDKYGAGRERAEGEEERLGAVISRLAYWLAERGVDKAVVRREGDTVRVVVNGETVAEVKAKAVKEEERESVIFDAWGKWVEEEDKKAAELVAKMEPRTAEDYELRALLATDGGYKAEGEVNAGTTSVLQAALYRVFGMEVSHTGVGSLTEDGLKPQLAAKLYREGGGEKVVEMIRRDLEEGLKTLLDNAKLREELREKALKLLGEMKISVQGADEETGKGKQRIEEVIKKIGERIVKFLTELRLGEKGAVCLVDCQFGESVLTYKHEPYARVIVPLVHYIASDASEEEVAKFLAYTTLFDGHVSTGEISLTLGNFHVKEASKRLPLDVYDKIALYIILAAKYGVGVRRVYIRKDATYLYFDVEYAAGMFATAWTELSRLWSFGIEHGLYADRIFNKLEGIRKYVEEYVNKLRIEYTLYSPQGVDPWVEVRFKDEKGNEVAHINIRWDGESLHAVFNGVREKAERLASILNALGAEAEAKEYGGKWRVVLYTDSITAIRRAEWLEAIKALVEELYKRRVIDDEQKERLLTEINTGSNTVEIAGVEISVWQKIRGKSKALEIMYQPRSANAFDAAANALRDAGFVEGVHFTAKRPEGGEKGYIRLKLPAGLWRLVELSRQGVDWADKALRRLEEIAKARGFYDLLEEYLRRAIEAETVDPRGLVAEDAEKGIRAVIKDVRVMREGGRPRVVVEYEVNGEPNSFSFIWGVTRRGGVMASVRLDDERALVLAALLGDGSIKGKRGDVTLYSKHLFALARLTGIGWELLRWYAEVMKTPSL
ncbi:MAG: PaRep2b protein, partial [Pyrobaculum sp.]